MHTQLFDDMQEEYNRALRARRVKRALAQFFRGTALALLLLGFGALIALVNNPFFSAAAIIVVLLGAFSDGYLETHH